MKRTKDKIPSTPNCTPIQNTSECVGYFVVNNCHAIKIAVKINITEITTYDITDNFMTLDFVNIFTNQFIFSKYIIFLQLFYLLV